MFMQEREQIKFQSHPIEIPLYLRLETWVHFDKNQEKESGIEKKLGIQGIDHLKSWSFP